MKYIKTKVIRRPAFFLSLALITGILTAYFLIELKLSTLFKIILFLEIFLFALYLLFYFKLNKEAIFSLLIIIFLITGSFLYAFEEYKFQSKYSIKNFAGLAKADIIAKIIFDLGDLESNKIQLQPIFINKQKVKYGRILIYNDQLKAFNDGDLIFINLSLSKVRSALNPGAFSFADYSKKDGIYLQGFKAENIKLIRQNKSLKNLLILFKKDLLKNINLLFKNKSAAFIKAVLLGEKEYLNNQQKDLLRNSGASHLLAISGLHMGIIILSFSFILFKICAKKRNALYLLTCLSFFYLLLVGAAVSIIRAALLALLFLWADEFKREGDFLNILAFTLIINLLFNPLALFTVSLQLSYILVLALFYISPLLNKFLPAFFAVSLAAQLGAFAISAYYFNEFSWIAILTNLWLIPFISILLPLIFLVVLLSLFCFGLASNLVFLVEFNLNLLFTALKLMLNLQGLPIVIARPNLLTIIIYYVLLFSLPIIYKKRYIKIKFKELMIWRRITVTIFLLLFISFFINLDSNLLEINYLAVGQGDGIFIKFPDGKNMIVDTGPPGKDGRSIEYSIISFLNYSGIKKIDYLLISHFDADHVGGIAHLLKRKKVKNILIPPFKEKTIFHLELEKYLSSNRSNLVYLKEQMKMKIGSCTLKILNPPQNSLFEDRNENSIVFLLNYYQKKFLFTGDLSQAGEKRIIKKYQLGEIDVLKVGHHGSNTSSCNEFLRYCKPKLAVICVGKNNFGHPATAVLNRLKKNNIHYLRTDKNGMIKVISNGKKLWLNSFK